MIHGLLTFLARHKRRTPLHGPRAACEAFCLAVLLPALLLVPCAAGAQDEAARVQAERLRDAYPDAAMRLEPNAVRRLSIDAVRRPLVDAVRRPLVDAVRRPLVDAVRRPPVDAAAVALVLRIGDLHLPFATPEGCVDTATLHRDGQTRDLPLCALFMQPYPVGAGGREPEPGFDPGRIRNEALLKALYGHTPEAVQAACVTVRFLGRDVRFNARHGAAAALARVGVRLRPLLADPRIRDWVLPVDDGQYWRVIAGSARLSAHAFGIAIDLNPERAPYWRWTKNPQQIAAARRDYPQEVVDAFEAEGFIWGGKWSAFDLMHFEYRPELLPS